MKIKFVLFNFILSIVLLGCISTNKSREEFFGYNNQPEYETKKSQVSQTTPYIYSKSENTTKHSRTEKDAEGNTYVINNYFPYPYDPRYFPSYDPFAWNFSFYFGDKYYDPLWGYDVIYIPYNYKHRYVYYPYPYWDYWWDRRRTIIYVPYDVNDDKPRERTVRDFGPSRSGFDYDNSSVPTKEPRSSSRGEEGRKNIVKPEGQDRNAAEPVKIKLPEKTTSPKETPRTSEPPKSEPNTKQERSSTRPR